MKLIKVAAAALNQIPLDWDQNSENILQAIKQARDAQASVLCLPELCITGYGCEDAFMSPGIQATALEVLDQIRDQTRGLVVSVGLPVMYAGGLFNVVALLVDQILVGMVAKQHLAGDGIHYEPRWFKQWPEGIQAEIEIANRTVPLGDYLFDLGGVRLGFEVCEDAWVGTRPGASLANRGADILLNPSASHFAFGKHEIRKRFVLEGSRAFQVTYVYSNLVGNESGRAIFDGDAMIATKGKIVSTLPRFGYSRSAITTAMVDVDATRVTRARTGSFRPDLDGDESDVVDVNYDFPELKLESNQPALEAWENSESIKEEEFTRAVALGLFDYVRKSRSRGVVISLSGGADSAAVAVLSALMFRLAEQSIGFEAIKYRLAHVAAAQNATTTAELCHSMITTAYQSTRNSSEVTRSAAATIAQAIRSQHFELNVDPIVESYVKMISANLGRELTWEKDDIALQNIQARVRAPSVWMLANLSGSLLLSTSNRSEAAVGYATMDGDTSGGLSPIAGIDKAFLRQWLRWMEELGPQSLGPIPELKVINSQQPTAELRPANQNQTDEDDLMPYPVLDRIERLAIRDKLTPNEVLRHLCLELAEQGREQLKVWVIRFFRLWSRNQWKRERYAPCFHLDDENLDPKTWCRFPILSGGFEKEIQELECE